MKITIVDVLMLALLCYISVTLVCMVPTRSATKCECKCLMISGSNIMQWSNGFNANLTGAATNDTQKEYERNMRMFAAPGTMAPGKESIRLGR